MRKEKREGKQSNKNGCRYFEEDTVYRLFYVYYLKKLQMIKLRPRV